MENNGISSNNQERFLSLDLMKLVALILMPCIHIFNLFCAMGFTGSAFPLTSVSLQMGLIYLIVPGVFMFCMGAGLVLSKKQTPKELCLRGLKLLLVGFILNAVRASIYLWLGLLVEKACYLEFWYWLWGSDILYFAGLYFLLFSLFRKLRLSDMTIAAISVMMLIVSHIIMPVLVENATLVQLLGNFVYIDEDSCFPLLSWAVFPTAGYLYMKHLNRSNRKPRYAAWVFGVTAAFLAAIIGGLLLTGNLQPRYYLWGEEGFMMDIPSAAIAVSVAVMYASILYLLSCLIKKEKNTSLIGKISANINTIYCIHWTIIMYFGLFLLLFTDYQTNSPAIVYLIGVLVFIVSTLLTFAYQRNKKRKA